MICSLNDFLNRRMHYLWMHCCTRSNYGFCISQGSVATVFK